MSRSWDVLWDRYESVFGGAKDKASVGGFRDRWRRHMSPVSGGLAASDLALSRWYLASAAAIRKSRAYYLNLYPHDTVYAAESLTKYREALECARSFRLLSAR